MVASPDIGTSGAVSNSAPVLANGSAYGESDRAIGVFASESNFVAGQRIARALSESSLVPEAFRKNLPNVLIAMELANRIGASVLMVMQNLDIIHGRPSWRATFLIATVNACGRFTPLRFREQGTKGTDDWGCRAVAKDRETGEECVGPLVTIGTAKAEGWYGKSGSKWKTIPELMLNYRAATWWARLYAPELSLGMVTSDEVDDTNGYRIGHAPVSIQTATGNPKQLEADLLASSTAQVPAAPPPSNPGLTDEERARAIDAGVDERQPGDD
jgi:hypothetical protein